MKSKRKESAPYSGPKAGRLKSKSFSSADPPDLTAEQHYHTMRMYTPKASAALMSKEQAQYYKDVANELLWKSKAQARIIANLREALIMAGVQISMKAMDPTFNLSRSTLTKAAEAKQEKEAQWIYVPGQGWILKES